MPETVSTLLVSSWAGLPLWAWAGFLIIVFAVLAADLGLFHRDAHEPSFRESSALAAFCMSLGLAFSGVVYWLYATGHATSLDPAIANAATPSERGWHALELYLTGWFVEQTLAIDNIFVMSMIFGYFAIPPKYQHRVLFYGILGVIVMRAVMIGVGAALVHRFEWVLYVFAVFLVVTGIKMLIAADSKPDLESNPILKWMRGHIRITPEFEGQRFFVRRPDAASGKLVRHATPLFVALVLIEFADLIFAVELGARRVRHYPRPVHRLHLEHLRNPRPACALCRAGRHGPPLPLFEICPGPGADLGGREDLAPAVNRQDPA